MRERDVVYGDVLPEFVGRRDETCYVCTLQVGDGDTVYRLRDGDGLQFFVHEACMDKMESVNEEGADAR